MKDIIRYIVYGSIYAVPFVLLIIAGSMFFPYITGKNFAFRILVEIGFGAWLLLALYDRTYRPRFSYILASVLCLLGVMFLADSLGEYAPKSFWSNYERMEGWVTLLHFFLYTVVAGSVLTTEKQWVRFFNISLIAASLMSLYALGQIAGLFSVSQGVEWRVDGRLGNSSYLGVYLLFQIFIAAWLYLHTKSKEAGYFYVGLALVFAFILFNTGTRGSTLGLICGSTLGFLYLATMAPRGASVRKWAMGGLVAILIAGSGLLLARDTEFVKTTPALNRIANITLSEGNIRLMVWKVALEGVKERPILGWGQENFNYVFNKYYEPGLYVAETWYDRTHNIFLDWLIAGGVLGLIAYLAILFSALFEVNLKPLWNRFRSKEDPERYFSVGEQALILALLAGYMFHNLFVFDNLASWIFYALLLALIHSRVSRPIRSMDFKVGDETLDKIAVPIVAVATMAVVYMVNVPSMLAARDIIAAYRADTVEAKLDRFNSALNRGSFADQEITEQFAQVAAQAMASEGVKEVDRIALTGGVKNALTALVERKPNDARLYVISASFYRSVGDEEKALSELKMAETISPQKQDIISERAMVYLVFGNPKQAVVELNRAYSLDTRNNEAKVRLAAAHLLAGDKASFDKLITEEELAKKGDLWITYASDPLMLQAAHQQKHNELVEYILVARTEIDPTNSSYRVNLAAFYYETGNYDKALATLEEAVKDIPTFKTEGESLINQLKAEGKK